MHFQNIFDLLQDDQKFKDWKREFPDTYLSSAFVTFTKEMNNDWQINYYDKKTDKTTTFTILNEEVSSIATDETFRKPGTVIEKLNVENVKFNLADVLTKIDTFIKNEYPQEYITKKLIVLQVVPEFGQVWNITCISMTMKALNIKVDTLTGEITHHKLTNLLDFRSEEHF